MTNPRLSAVPIAKYLLGHENDHDDLHGYGYARDCGCVPSSIFVVSCSTPGRTSGLTF